DKEKKDRIIGCIERGFKQGVKLRLDGRRDIKIACN
ncbi:hypothetical protein HKBW3S09_01544, partial [Candidatus Hakubella thermalkaliphila]